MAEKKPMKIFHRLAEPTEDMASGEGDPRHFERLVEAMEKIDPEARIAHAIAAKYQKQE